MKKIIFSLLIILVFGCSYNEQYNKHNYLQQSKYKIGDIVYLKPDSTKAVIIYVEANRYRVRFTNKAGNVQETDPGDWGRHLLMEEMFYGTN